MLKNNVHLGKLGLVSSRRKCCTPVMAYVTDSIITSSYITSFLDANGVLVWTTLQVGFTRSHQNSTILAIEDYLTFWASCPCSPVLTCDPPSFSASNLTPHVFRFLTSPCLLRPTKKSSWTSPLNFHTIPCFWGLLASVRLALEFFWLPRPPLSSLN